MILPLQQLALRLVSTEVLVSRNMCHLLGHNNRLLEDLYSHPTTPIDEYFLSAILDQGNTSFFWMMEFINRKIHYLPINTAVFACWQENYNGHQSLVVFAMRTDWDRVIMFVYHTQEEGDRMTDNLFRQIWSHRWVDKDWVFLSRLTWKYQFPILSRYVRKKSS